MRFKIYENGKLINTIVSNEAFCKKYCADNGYVYAIDEAANETPQREETPVLTREDEIDAILIDQEYRLTKLELGVSE